MEAQVQAISLVLISGIVLSLAGAAYFWGKPLMEKRSSITDIATAESFITQLDKEILDVARNKGVKTLNIPAVAGASLSASPEPDNNIIFKFVVTQPMLTLGDKNMPVPIETSNIEINGTYGESPRIITLESEVYESLHKMTLTMTYRTLFTSTTPQKAYQIVLNPSGKTGNDKVSVSYAGTETTTITGVNGDVDLLKTKVDVTIS